MLGDTKCVGVNWLCWDAKWGSEVSGDWVWDAEGVGGIFKGGCWLESEVCKKGGRVGSIWVLLLKSFNVKLKFSNCLLTKRCMVGY